MAFAEDKLFPIHYKAHSLEVENTTPYVHSLNHNFLCCAGAPSSGRLLRKCHLLRNRSINCSKHKAGYKAKISLQRDSKAKLR